LSWDEVLLHVPLKESRKPGKEVGIVLVRWKDKELVEGMFVLANSLGYSAYL
jgi:hypothetical protein